MSAIDNAPGTPTLALPARGRGQRGGSTVGGRPLPIPAFAAYIRKAGLRGASGEHIPGALSIPTGAVPDPVRGPGHTAPTYAVGSRDRFSDGFRGSALFFMVRPDTPPTSKATGCAPRHFARRDALDPALARRGLAAVRRAGASGAAGTAWPRPVGGFWPIRSEIDRGPLLEAPRGAAKRVACPSWLRPAPGLQGLGAGRRPRPASASASASRAGRRRAPLPRLLVPLAAFDRRGRPARLREGALRPRDRRAGGRHPVLAIGVAFSGQEIARRSRSSRTTGARPDRHRDRDVIRAAPPS